MPADPQVVEYLRQAAIKRGIDPDTFLKVSRAEALNVFDPNKPDLGGDEGSSFGPFQLHYKGMSKSMPNAGMGDDFTKATGLHASDPSTWRQQVDYVADHLAGGGTWTPWMGAKAVGITGRMGLPDGPAITMGAPQGASGTVAPGTIMPSLAAAPGIPAGGVAPVDVASGGMSLSGMPDKIGTALWGDNAGEMKRLFGADAPATSPAKSGLGLMGKALGTQGDVKDPQATTITPSQITMDDSAARMAAGQQLMASLMATRNNKRPRFGAAMRMGG